jgi:CHAT domain-containing protein/tetratricopeptide (TPR) repeat protein
MAYSYVSLIVALSIVIPETLNGLQTADKSLSGVQTREEATYLIPGKTIKQEIAAGKSLTYQITLSAGQFLRIVFDGQYSDFAIALLAPSHRKILELNNHRFRPVPLSLNIDSSGTYTVEVHSLQSDANAAHYEITIEPVREATPQSSRVITAERVFAEAEKLRAEWNSKSLSRSISKYEEARATWHAFNNQKEEAEALKCIGEVYSILGNNQKALDYFNRALPLSRMTGGHQLEIGILNHLGEVQIDLGDFQAALDYCKQALALSRQAGYIEGQAQALNNIGLVHHSLSDFENALSSFNQALDLWRATGDCRGQAQTLTNIGYSHSDLGDLRRSMHFLNEALSLWLKSKDLRGEALTLTALALLNSSLGEMQKALDAHSRAIRLLQTMGDQAGEAVTLNGLAYVYATMGDEHKALDLYKRALQLFRATGRRDSEAISIGHIGEIYNSLGEKQKALDYYNQKLEISRSLGDRRAEAYTLKDIGDIFVYFGEKDKALDYFKRALSLSQSLSDPRGQAYALNSVGYVYEMMGQKQKALDYYKQAIALNRATEDRAGEAQTLHNIASVARDLGDFKYAYDQSKTLLSTVEALRTKVTSQELRASYFASAHQHYELYIDILMRLHKQNPTAGYAAAALEASERARGRVLLDLLNEARADIRQGVDPALLQQERDLQQLLNAKAERQVRLLSEAHTEEQSAAIKKEVAEITTRYEEALAQIRANSRRYATLMQPRTLSLSEIQQQLMDADTMLLEYSLGDERSYLWAVTSTSAIAYELPGRNKIEDAAIRLYRSLTAHSEPQRGKSPQQRRNTLVEDSQYSQAATELTKMLLEPIAPHLATKRLVIVADGALQYVPFAALPDPNDVKQARQEQQPLVVNHEIINLPSVSIFSALRSEINERSPAPKALAVLADPVFEKDDPRVNLKPHINKKEVNTTPARLNTIRGQQPMRSDASENMRERLRFQRLPFSSSEAIAISDLVPEQERRLALGFEASLSTAKSGELQQYRIVHFATHGLIYGAHPQLYGIVLSLVDKQGNSQDGFLRLNEIYNLKLAADLVVLSACQTALGKDIKGEGLVGIARGFMYSGASRVVASLWKVDDRASAELMKYFYEGLFGQPRLQPAAALRAAQVKMWKQMRWRNPYFWAAFTLQGEWK